ncbi:hypothetical protein V2J09_004759 [Rumex salicifolius]
MAGRTVKTSKKQHCILAKVTEMREAAYIKLLLVFFEVLAATGESFVSEEIWALNTFKEALYEDPFLVLSSWNSLDPDPCEWSNVFCSSARNHVIKLNISSSSLKGFLVPELGFLTYLEQLILHGNNLIGTIPKEISMLKNLKVLDLGKNQLTGPIPPEMGNMKNLVKINLQSNVLTGTIPPELANLKKLQELRLDKNKLQGIVHSNNDTKFSSNINGMFASAGNAVNFCHSSQLKVADFSYNFFIGSIPKCLNYLPRSSFQENCLEEKNVKQRPGSQCGTGAAPLSQVKSHTVSSSSKSKPHDKDAKHQVNSKPAWILVLEIVTGIMVGALVFVAIFTIFRRCNSKQPMMIIPWRNSSSAKKDRLTIYIDPDMLKDVPRYGRQELEVACEDFSNIIGSSSDSVVYKGTVKGGPEIAAISFCIKEEQWSGYHELYFQREVVDLARLDHDNTGKLLGYCRDSSPFTRMLVIEYASNGTLSEHLHFGGDGPDGCHLSWARRMKIIIGIAQGLKYLHSELDPPFTISELNSSSVYLTEDFSPKLVDFESWKTILARSEKNSKSIESDGAICVLPNSIEERHLDMKGNVYAFGVLLLEIISGRPPYSKDNGSLLDWARDYIEVSEEMAHLVDPELKHFEHEDLRVICEVASLCIKEDPTKRPLMNKLCATLESRIDLSISAELRSSSLAWAELALDL